MKHTTKKDVLLMSFFRNNARENLTRISRLTHIPVSTIFDKLKDYEKELVKKHTTLLDFRKLGFDIKVNVLYRISRDSREEFRDFLMNHVNVNSIFKVNNGFDFLVEAIFKDLNDYHKFNEQLEKFNIQVKQEMFILEDLKREEFLSDMKRTESLFAEE